MRTKLLGCSARAVLAGACYGARAIVMPLAVVLLVVRGAQAQQPVAALPTAVDAAAGVEVSGAALTKGALQLVGVEKSIREALLAQLTQDYPEVSVPVSEQDAQRIAAELGAHIRKRGYPIAQVVLLQRDAELLKSQGQLRLHLLLGGLGKVSVRTTGTGYSSQWLEALVSQAMCADEAVGEGCAVSAQGLERATLLLGSLPGVSGLNLSLGPQDVQPGQTGLQVDVDSERRVVNAAATADNYGLAQTGRERYGISLVGSSVLRDGDTLGLQVSDTLKNSIAAALSWNQPLGASGLRLASQLTRSQFSVPLDSSAAISGVAEGVSLGLSYPVVLRYDSVVNAQWDLGYMSSRAELSRSFTFQDRRIPYTSLSITGNTGPRSLAQAGGYVSWGLSLMHGKVHDTADGAQAQDALSAKALDEFQRLSANLMARAPLGLQPWTAGVNLRAQAASRNLDPSMKMAFGGASGVRAYSPEEGSFDDGYMATLDLQRSFSVGGVKVVGSAFVDHAVGNVNHVTWPAWNSTAPSRRNTRQLSAYGIAVTAAYAKVEVSLSLASAFASSDASLIDSDRTPGRVWLSARVNF